MKNVFDVYDVFYQLIFACYEIEYRLFQNHFSSERKKTLTKKEHTCKTSARRFLQSAE